MSALTDILLVPDVRPFAVAAGIMVVPGGIDRSVFSGRHRTSEFDLILVARLVPIKQIDLFIRVVALLQAHRQVKAAIVGDGPRRAALEQQAAGLAVSRAITL